MTMINERVLPNNNEDQLADADQRHGPLRDWEVEGLLLDLIFSLLIKGADLTSPKLFLTLRPQLKQHERF